MKLASMWALIAVVGLTGCTHSVHQVAFGGLEDIPEGETAHFVEAEAEQFVFFYMTGNTDFADEAYRSVLAKCPNGELHGMEARHSTSHGFLSHTNHMRVTALCVEPHAPRSIRRPVGLNR